MSTYSKCPHCENDVSGENIYACSACGCVQCKKCDDDGQCPECGETKMRLTGYIDPQSGRSDKEMPDGVFAECPRCGKNDDEDYIWECLDCECVHCADCSPDTSHCPNCKSERVEIAGYIDNG